MALRAPAKFLIFLWLWLMPAAYAQSEAQEKQCARRISNTLGISWRNAYGDLKGASVQSGVRTWLRSAGAIETLASYINTRFNPVAGANLGEDMTYFAVKYILKNQLPWRDLFIGRYHLNVTNGQATSDLAAPALGYFNSEGWKRRYRGNEGEGYLLTASYRTLQNTIGLNLVPAPNNASGDASSTGRERAECRGCHFDSPYALDKVARLLPRRKGVGGGATVVLVPVEPQVLFNGVEIKDHEQLIATLVNSQAFSFWSCSLAFQFVYGRPESACEAPIFDACVDAFEREGSMEDALASLLEDPRYCQVGP